MKRALKINMTICIVVVSVLLIISACISVLYFLLCNKFINSDPDDYPDFVAHGEIKTKSFDIDGANRLDIYHPFTFIEDTSMCNYTDFTNAIPNVKIINDTDYTVEITANAELIDKMNVVVENNIAYISCSYDIYSIMPEDVWSDEYLGVDIDCTKIDIIVHAPISVLDSDVPMCFDFDVAPADRVYISVYDSSGTAYNIDTKKLKLAADGSSDVTLSGKVSERAELMPFHDTHVNAWSLDAKFSLIYPSRTFGGSTYVLSRGLFLPVFDITIIITCIDVIAILIPLILLGIDAGLIVVGSLCLFKKRKDKAILKT